MKFTEMNKNITTPHTPESIQDQGQLFIKGEAHNTNVYARYGYEEEREWEKKLAEKIHVPDAAILNSGMAAIHTAIEAEKIKAGDVVLCSQDVYGCTSDLFDNLKKRGVIIKYFKPGDPQALKELAEQTNPRCIILESVANSMEMRIADLNQILTITNESNKNYNELTPEKLLEKRINAKFKEDFAALDRNDKDELLEAIKTFEESNNYFCFRKTIKTISEKTGINRQEIIKDLADIVQYISTKKREKLSLIIDNSLPSPELYNIIDGLNSDTSTELVVVESGTKHYQSGQDSITLGVAYSNSPKKIEEIKKTRMMLGTYLQPASLKELPEDSLKTMENKMLRHAENALALAETLISLEGAGTVYHPNLPNHPDKELADKFAPQGIVSLFYMELNNVTSAELVKKLYEQSEGKIKIGGSFGHPDTWVLPLGEKTIRVAAGSERKEDFDEIINLFNGIL